MTRSAQTSLSASTVHYPNSVVTWDRQELDTPQRKPSQRACLGRFSNENQILKDAYVTTMTAQGTHLDKFNYEVIPAHLKIAGLGNIGYSFRQADHINFTVFYARNAINDYMSREGIDAEKNNITSSNSVFHADATTEQPVAGTPRTDFSVGCKLGSASYGLTNSDGTGSPAGGLLP